MKYDVVKMDGRFVVHSVDDIGLCWNETICSNDALKFRSKGGGFKVQDGNVALVCERVCDVGDVKAEGRRGVRCVLVTY